MATSTNSPSSSSSSSTPPSNPNPNPNPNPNSNSSSDPIQSWWESISLARSRILSLSSLLSLPSLSSLADSDRPAAALLSSAAAYSAVSAAFADPSSGSGEDHLCQWLYETFQSSDPDLKLIVLSFIPLISSLYLSRVISSPYSSSLAGFESVILTIYQSETRLRGGKPLLISIPDLSQPSLYHTPRPVPKSMAAVAQERQAKVGVLSPPLEPQMAVKSTKRACIVAVALGCYYRKISAMPVRSKIDFCEFVVGWAGQDCCCRYELDDEESSLSNFDEDGEIGSFSEEMGRLGINERSNSNGSCNGNGNVRGSGDFRSCRIPLPWELMQPVLRILGHCLLAPMKAQEVRDAASAAIRSVYARASHELMPQAILASRSLIQLDKSTRKAARDASGMAVIGGIASNPTTPSKPKKPEVLLVSK